jgi:hypothetical protein
MTRTVRSFAAVAALILSATAASAQGRVEAGVLECRAGQTTGLIVASQTVLACTFRPTVGGPLHNYTAVVRRIGVELGITAQSALAWAVFAPTVNVGPGDLGGLYAGVTAGATVVVGASANVLVGGSNNSFALQPLSLGAQAGLNVSAGVAELDLRAVR